MSRLECIAVEADGGGEGQEVEVVLMEPRPFRPFKSSEEYLVAMKEDLAEWLHRLYYPQLNIDFDNFMDVLEDGVALCKVNYFVSTPGAASTYIGSSICRITGRK